jgi:mannose-1-phosphate guanylyltransferase / phosphomannomutase
MKAVVMAGGEGSRLRPLTSQFPKPLVPVAGTPVIEHVLRLLRNHGINDVILTLAYLGAEIRNRIGDGSDFDMNVEYVVEDRPLGTAGSVRNARDLIDDTFVVISGDALTDIDLSWAVEEHRKRQAAATIVLKSVPNPLEYGVVVTDDEGRITRFLEKPSWGEVFSDRANTGIYVMEASVLDNIRDNEVSDWSQDVFPHMLRNGDLLAGVAASGYWCDIGNIETYVKANWDALEGKVRCHIPGRKEGNIWYGEGIEIDDDVTIDGPAFIGDDVKLKHGVHINDHAVLDKFVVVDQNAKLSNTIVWSHTYIGEGTRSRQAIIGRSVTLKDGCFLEDNTVVGDDCVIGRDSHLRAGVKIWPHKEVEPRSIVNESIIWAGGWRSGLFTSYGLGGLINVELTPEYCARLGAVFGAMLPRGATVAVGRDHARSSRMIKRALVSGVVSAGGTVRDVGELPVPVTQFSARVGNCDAAIHVLVSPLDQRSVDIRFFDGEGLPLDKRSERRFENLFFREDFRRAAFYEMGEIERGEPIEHYRERLLSSVDLEAIRKSSMRMVIDYDYSTASAVLPEVLNKLETFVVPLNAGVREGPAQSSVPPEIAMISQTVSADFGVFLGPSGEFLNVIDESGRLVTPHKLFALLAAWQLQRNPGTVVLPATMPHWIAEMIEQASGNVRWCKAEFSSILRAAAGPDVVFAGDGHGRHVWPEHLVAFDAMCTVVKLIEWRAVTGASLAEAVDRLPAPAYVVHEEFCPWEFKGRVMRMLIEEHQERAVDLTDGFKIQEDGGYVLVRPDPDAPAFQIVADAGSQEGADRLVETFMQKILAAEEKSGYDPRSAAGK